MLNNNNNMLVRYTTDDRRSYAAAPVGGFWGPVQIFFHDTLYGTYNL